MFLCPYCDCEMKRISRTGEPPIVRERYECDQGDGVQVEVTRFGGWLAATWIRFGVVKVDGEQVDASMPAPEWMSVKDALQAPSNMELWRPPQD